MSCLKVRVYVPIRYATASVLPYSHSDGTLVETLDDHRLFLWNAGAGNYLEITTSNSPFYPTVNTYATGFHVWAFGVDVDAGYYMPNSTIYSCRPSSVLDTFDFAAAATGVWTAAVPIETPLTVWGLGSCGAYDNATNHGNYVYINANASRTFFRFCLKTKRLEPWTYLPRDQSTAAGGNRLAISLFVDGATKLAALNMIGSTQQLMYQCFLQR